MKIVSLLLATAVAAIVGSAPALAQSAGTPSGNSAPSPQMNAPTHPDQNEWARDRDWSARPGWQQGGYGWMGPWMMGPQARWMMGGGPGWMMGRQPGWMEHHRGWGRWRHRPRGAHFSFRRGDARIDIQCPANQSLKDCVDAAGTLIDKVSSMRPHTPPPGRPKPPAGTSGSRDHGPVPGGNMPKMPPDPN